MCYGGRASDSGRAKRRGDGPDRRELEPDRRWLRPHLLAQGNHRSIEFFVSTHRRAASREVERTRTSLQARYHRSASLDPQLAPSASERRELSTVIIGETFPIEAPLWWATFACITERRLVDQNSHSWNRTLAILLRLESLQHSAGHSV